jgi:hypothetical protein
VDGEGWAIGTPAGYQPRGRAGLTDGKPRAAVGINAAASGYASWQCGGCGGAVGGEGGHGREGPGE